MSKYNSLLVILIVLKLLNGHRISDSVCDETMSILTDSRSLNPHLMEIVRGDFEPKETMCLGTLISEYFVLVCGYCMPETHLNRLIVRKFKLPEEEYSTREFFTIKYIWHPPFRSELHTQYEIELIQLEDPVLYTNEPSIYRPACLWTNSLPLPEQYLLYGKNILEDSDLMVKPFPVTRNDACTNETFFTPEEANGFRHTHVCFNTNDDFMPEASSPIIVNVENQTYVFGVLVIGADYDEYILSWATKVDPFIPWIESTVWSNHTIIECGLRKLRNKRLMSFSLPTYHGDFPWHVALYRNNQKYICGGTILNNRMILTAAHCVHDERGIVPANRTTVVAGTHSLTNHPIEARTYVVERVKVHESYDNAYLVNDIALLKLANSIEFSPYIQPICLSNTINYNIIEMGTVAGWGHNEHNEISDILLQASLPIIDEFECRASNRDFFPNYLNSNNYCAGSGNGTSVCSGDSGSGMIFKYKLRWYIRGFVSMGPAVENSNRCDITQPALFTDVIKLYDWIINNMRDDK